MWLPLPITNIVVSCRWLPHFLIQLTHGVSQRHGNASRVSSSAPTLTTWIPIYYQVGRGTGNTGEPATLLPKRSCIQSLPSAEHPEKGEGWAEPQGKGAVVCLF